ncbi:FAD-dependent oxidoreductase [Aphanothece sacrum]|uniref:Mercuric reductase n=1 Tax=Aphanothece sacrum FPU1 TaxID=1920663 RepID=A0A401IGL7_APHSA|nr:FAD-dependent oxidoreductase [Aphanothece sacrum]GBF80437.1 mercuric reductase [Aphanothece sacrum FPU1]GBF85518.1 mercuric reductase [Aphanothece sacrum FPU3]
MSLDYDLVIIGNTPEASYAALEAVKLKARVAWVLGEKETNTYTEIDRCTFSYLTQLDKQWQILTKWNLNTQLISNLNLTQIKYWTNQVKQDIQEAYSLSNLASAGVDIITESGEFCRLPNLGFIVKNRTLRSRYYLLATGSIFSIPDIEGLAEVDYLTPETLELDKLSNNLIIFSQTPAGIELAQNLNRIGKQITLIVENHNILPQEDTDAVKLIQSQLEAEGIKLLINCPIIQIKEIDHKKWIQAGNKAIEADEIILVTNQQPNIKGLNLEGVKVAIKIHRVIVNKKLQTTNPKIYSFGNIIREYSLSNIAQYEANIIIKNTLFYPFFKVNYKTVPIAIITNPSLARVGLTETQARQQYKNDIIIIKQNFNTLSKANIMGETTGFCKIITRRNGIIIGGHIVGIQSDELINLIALAMKNNIKIQQLSKILPPYTAVSNILFELSRHWQYQRFKNNKTLNYWLETLLFWRRKWLK